MTRDEARNQLATLAALNHADLRDGTFSRSKKGDWDDWRSHVPGSVMALWKHLDADARAAVYLTAFCVTAYTHSGFKAAKPNE